VATHANRSLDVLWIALVLILLALAAVLFVALRRIRRSPIDRLILAWASVDQALARGGWARPKWRTPVAHVAAISLLPQTEQGRAALGDLAAIATILQNMAFGSTELAPADVEWAVRAARRARRAISAGVLTAPVEDHRGSPSPKQAARTS
jgi:hypothetical protein